MREGEREGERERESAMDDKDDEDEDERDDRADEDDRERGMMMKKKISKQRSPASRGKLQCYRPLQAGRMREADRSARKSKLE